MLLPPPPPSLQAWNKLFAQLNTTQDAFFANQKLDLYVLLGYHFVPGVLSSTGLMNGQVISTLAYGYPDTIVVDTK